MNCLDNLDKCKAACCKGVTFKSPRPKRNQKVFMFKQDEISDDMIRYYDLHDITVTENNELIFHAPIWKYVNGQLHVTKHCNALTDNLRCSIHENKPQVCKDFNKTTAYSGEFTVPPNCIFRR